MMTMLLVMVRAMGMANPVVVAMRLERMAGCGMPAACEATLYKDARRLLRNTGTLTPQVLYETRSTSSSFGSLITWPNSLK